MPGNYEVAKLLRRLEPLRRELAMHRLYARLTSREAVGLFMEYHVYAVWAFTALLTAIQARLAHGGTDGQSVGSCAARHFVEHVILEELHGTIGGIGPGQFALYRRAMQEVHADARGIDHFLAGIAEGIPVSSVMVRCGTPIVARRFIQATQDAIDARAPHVLVATFALGWEDAITSMFGPLRLAIPKMPETTILTRFLDRRIEHDRLGRSSMALALLSQLCGSAGDKWREAEAASIDALASRLAFWSGIADVLEHSHTFGSVIP